MTILLGTVLFLDKIFWWDVLAIGIAWRFYLFVLTLPAVALWDK